jgi:glycosyltransferase involved in cell wall biosynthesis
MKIYLTGAYEYMAEEMGFGVGANNVYHSLKAAGLNVICKDKKSNEKYQADIEICSNQPDKYTFLSDGYKIGYTPWESTEVPASWYWPMKNCDEIWTTSDWCRDVFQRLLPEKKIFTYRHGIEERFAPKKRKYNTKEPFTFLYIGEPYNRKDGQLVVDTFAKLFGNNENYRLIVKGTLRTAIRVTDPSMPGMFFTPDMLYNNIKILIEKYTDQEMLALYELADVFVYPTWGEGWGFNPLQAMAMGIPTISTYDWADYKKYITVPIPSSIAKSPWQDIHPGNMYKPDKEYFEDAMKNAKRFHNVWCKKAFKNSFKIHEDYNWEKVTIPAVERLNEIYKNL